jgi:oligopeptide transport system substrate-binding protein
MFEEGSLDWYGDTFGSMSLEMVHELTTKKELITAASGGGIWLLCQTEVPHLASVKIRKAIACAIDRSMICDSLLQGGEKPAYTIVPPPVSLLDRPSFEYNPTAARQLFEEGMKELGYTRETYPPIELSYFSDPMVKAVVGVEQQQLQQNLGITVKLVPYDWGTFFKKWHSGDFQTLSLGWITWYPDPSYNLEAFKYKDKGLNFTRWGNPEFTELLDLADASCDTQIRNDYLRKAEHLLMQEFPVIPVFFTTFKYTKKPQVCGEALSQVGQLELRWMEKTT